MNFQRNRRADRRQMKKTWQILWKINFFEAIAHRILGFFSPLTFSLGQGTTINFHRRGSGANSFAIFYFFITIPELFCSFSRSIALSLFYVWERKSLAGPIRRWRGPKWTVAVAMDHVPTQPSNPVPDSGGRLNTRTVQIYVTELNNSANQLVTYFTSRTVESPYEKNALKFRVWRKKKKNFPQFLFRW